MKYFKNRPNTRRRGGSIIVVVAASTVALLGAAALAVDYGVLLADRNQLQRACDAGALAGASYLYRTNNTAFDENKARNEGMRVARFNGTTTTEVTFDSTKIEDSGNALRVSAVRQRQLFFIRVLGITDGRIRATAKARVNPQKTPQVIPIGITPQTYDQYKNDTSARILTMARVQKEDFIRRDGLTPYDPFVLTDFRGATDNGGKHGSPAQMQRQIAGQDHEDVKIGTEAYNIRADDNSAGPKLKDGLGAVFESASKTPWQDPATGLTTSKWDTIGDKYDAIYSGQSPGDNPRVVNLFITDPVVQQSGNYFFTVRGFAPVYIQQLLVNANGDYQLVVKFLPPTSGFAGQPVGLVE